MMEIVFWCSVFMIFYAYFGYPACLFVLSLFKRPSGHVNSQNIKVFPHVSFIIAAYNEEARIEAKIKETVALDYPEEKFEIIVASDCSSDRTDEIVNSFAGEGVILARAPERKGKENAQKCAVQASKGEILIFSDTATILDPEAIRNVVKNFTDPRIGCVSSEDRFIGKDGKISGEGAYVRYEMFLRKLESKVNTLVGLSGSFFAARRSVCENFADDLQSDFNTLLNSIKLNMIGVTDPDSIGYYHDLEDEKKEFNRKVRTVLRGISVFMSNLSLLNPLNYGLFSWQLFSHKLCRWLVPFFLITAIFTNICLLSSPFFFIVFILQGLFYFIAVYYYKNEIIAPKEKLKRINTNESDLYKQTAVIMKILYFFVSVNISILVAWWKYLKGDRATFWNPSKR